MTNGSRLTALVILIFSILVLASCQLENAITAYNDEASTQFAGAAVSDDPPAGSASVDSETNSEGADYGNIDETEGNQDRAFKVSKDKDSRYVLTLFNSDGVAVKEETYPANPVIKIIDNDILEIVIGSGSKLNVQFYNKKTGMISTVYNSPITAGMGKVVYMEDGVLIVSDMFDKSIFYKEIKRNFARTADPSIVISDAKFQEPDTLAFKYLEGNEFKTVTEVIGLSENEDNVSISAEHTLVTNDVMVLNQNEPVNKDKLKRDNTVEADFLDIKKDNRIADFKLADINGDKAADCIIAIEQNIKSIGSTLYLGDFKIIIQDGETKDISLLDSKFTDNLEGSGIYLLTGNFDEDMVSDLFIYVNTGGNGGVGSSLYKIITFKGNKPIALLGETRESMQVKAEGEFVDGYKFLIRYDPINYQYLVDLSSEKDKYKDLYSGDKVKESYAPYGSIDYFYELIPKDTDEDGILELLGTQYVSGKSPSDTIGTLRSLLKWDNVLKKYNVLKLHYIEDIIWDEDWYEIN